ncbi:MAG: hypothetical protein JWP57_3675 [Spirosoma sp.]|nr:hypothetical protein [Spirosoma sp.]
MKRLRFFRLLVLCLLYAQAGTELFAQVHVRGHFRSNGTYVQPYERTRPNHTITDNYSYPGNYNPNTGKITGGNVYNPPPTYSGYPTVVPSPSYSGYPTVIDLNEGPKTPITPVKTNYDAPTTTRRQSIPTSPPVETFIFVNSVSVKTASYAGMREYPSLDRTAFVWVPSGSMVKLIGQCEFFYYVTFNNQVGYLHFSNIDSNYDAFLAHNYQSMKLSAGVISNSPLKESPSYTSKTVYLIPAGAVVKITKYSDSYWQAEVNGHNGYLGTAYVESTSALNP